MIEWLIKYALRFTAYEPLGGTQLGDFIDWLQETGASPWVSVEDDWPRTGDPVFVAIGYPLNMMFNGYHISAEKFDPSAEYAKWLAYWQPIQPLPKEDNNGENPL